MFDKTEIMTNGEEFRDILIEFQKNITLRSLGDLVSGAVRLEIYRYHAHYMPEDYLISPNHEVIKHPIEITLSLIYEEIDRRDALGNSAD
jgi:hypothetical protein